MGRDAGGRIARFVICHFSGEFFFLTPKKKTYHPAKAAQTATAKQNLYG
jgi:hypothetical protein